ncbi:MAG: Gfo/Idh/MocA family oxidoreductase [Bacteroidota bacterium]
MKRRKFFSNLSWSMAGLGLATSCSNLKEKEVSGQEELPGEQLPGKVPVYREKIKTTFSKGGVTGSNERVVLALIGAGSWGTNLILTVTDIQKNVFVKYVCDVDDTRGGRAIKELTGIQQVAPIRVRDMRKVFEDEEVDGVIIATPQHWHALATIWACQAGKDVYVEKNISLRIGEGQKMVEAAMKYERIVQCGTQNRSADFAWSARDYIKSGKLGQVVAVNVTGLLDGPIPFNEKEGGKAPDTIDWNMWLGPAPKVPYSVSRHKSNLFYWDYSGGLALGNDAIHQVDLARIVLDNPGFPESVYCTGGRYLFDDQRDMPDYQMTTFDYGQFVLTLQTGEFSPYMLKTTPEIRHGDSFPEWKQNSTKIVIYGTEGVMYVGRMGGGWQVFGKDRQVVAQESGLFPLREHLGNFVDCIRSRNQPNGNIVEGHKSATLIHLANLSYRAGKKQLYFSGDHEAITNDQKARELARGTYRKGFEIPQEV